MGSQSIPKIDDTEPSRTCRGGSEPRYELRSRRKSRFSGNFPTAATPRAARIRIPPNCGAAEELTTAGHRCRAAGNSRNSPFEQARRAAIPRASRQRCRGVIDTVAKSCVLRGLREAESTSFRTDPATLPRAAATSSPSFSCEGEARTGIIKKRRKKGGRERKKEKKKNL